MYSTEKILPERDSMTSAIQFINSTASHIFLTGKAGTGKTTFLKNLAARTHKQLTIVAPTGIAALNAGGVTIHSQFLLPFGMFMPDRNSMSNAYQGGNFYNAHTLAQKHPINSVRKQVLRTIDLLVIDEVSMLRADLLDAIDARMKSVRGNFNQSFGGVQLLLIGDLYQLPPVVKRDEEMILRQHYNSAWFFESKALKQDGFVYIELDKIFRQSDSDFIGLLNNLRNNQPTRADIDELNKHYKSAGEIQNLREVITLTTHNYKADDLNLRALNELPGASHVARASIEGDFPESMFPVLQHLELKIGAQIMFTKNDNDEKIYFNGKLATVKSINEAEIKVEMAGTHFLYTLKKAIWENKRYTVSTHTQELEDEVIGTFEQYPVKLAWAITVHKSQGLTFDKAIIDVGQAFADGQVYVALSRLRTLDGLVMRTLIDPNVITTDKQIVSFTAANNQPEMLSTKMKVKQQEYIRHLVSKTFDLETLVKECAYIQRGRKDILDLEDKAMRSVLEQLSASLLNEKENTEKFRRQLLSLLEENNAEQLLARIKKGSEYYKKFLEEQVGVLLFHIEEIRQKKRMKTYLNSLSDLDQLFAKKLEEVDKALYLTESILEGKYQFDFSNLTESRASTRAKVLKEIRSKIVVIPEKKKKGGKKKKGEPHTSEITVKLLESGMNVEDIAKERELAVGTILGHLADAVGDGRISIYKFMTHEEVATIENRVREMPEDFTSKDLFTALEGKFNYGHLRAVMNHMRVSSSSLTID
jgi:PIF1-like helicase/Helix-turn-helix domain/Helicase